MADPPTSTSRHWGTSVERSAPPSCSGRRGNVQGALPQPVVRLSSVLHSPLLDRAGERLGRVEDLIVRLADRGYPPVTGLKARVGGRDLFVPVDKVAELDPQGVRLSGQKLSLGRFE